MSFVSLQATKDFWFISPVSRYIKQLILIQSKYEKCKVQNIVLSVSYEPVLVTYTYNAS
jgi:hypothetical protein